MIGSWQTEQRGANFLVGKRNKFGEIKDVFSNKGGHRVVLVEVVDTVNAVGSVDCKRNAIQTKVADNAGETLRVIRFSGRTQDSIQDWFRADAALF